MASETMFARELQAEMPWGEAHPKRGEKYDGAARLFAKRFPVGTELATEEFDAWGQENGFFTVPVGVAKDSDFWIGHTQRRHKLRQKIHNAGTHPRMGLGFAIETIGPGLWAVRSPEVAIAENTMADQLLSHLETKHRQLRYLMQSADWNGMPPHLRDSADAVFDGITLFQEMVEQCARHLTSDFSRFRRNLKSSVERGEIPALNSGIKAIVNDSEDEPSET